MTYAFAQRRNFIVVAFLFAMTCCDLALAFRLRSSLQNGFQDFTIYYTGARLLREGQSAKLYNLVVQYQTQLTFAHVPIRQGPLPYNHPPFEALLFVPFTFLGYWPAYLLWTAVNLVMLAATAALLRRFPKIRDLPPLVLGLGSLSFFPVALGIIQGQDTILLVLLLSLALISLDQGKDEAGGAWLAAGLFRPHMIVPLALLLAVRRWRLLTGFIPVALGFLAISVAIMGWGGPLAYVRFVLMVERTGAGGFGPQAVPNIRGIIRDLPGLGGPGMLPALLTALLSITVFAVALYRIRKGQDSVEHSFCLASLATILVSFHALSYDLTMLLPLVLFMLAAFMRSELSKFGILRLLVLVLLFLTPFYVYLLFAIDRFCWFGLILLWLFFMLLRIHGPEAEPA